MGEMVSAHPLACFQAADDGLDRGSLPEVGRLTAAGVRFGAVLAGAGYGLSASFRVRRDLAAWLAKWSGKYPKLTAWAEENIVETLTCFRLPLALRQAHEAGQHSRAPQL
jgi:hypothetical protein